MTIPITQLRVGSFARAKPRRSVEDGLSILRIGRLVRVLRLVKVARYTSANNRET